MARANMACLMRWLEDGGMSGGYWFAREASQEIMIKNDCWMAL